MRAGNAELVPTTKGNTATVIATPKTPRMGNAQDLVHYCAPCSPLCYLTTLNAQELAPIFAFGQLRPFHESALLFAAKLKT